jgi:ribosomal protein L40E
MEDENSILPPPKRTPWNKGELIGAKPLLARHVWSIRTKLQIERRARELAMFNLAIDSKPRADIPSPVRRCARERPGVQSASSWFTPVKSSRERSLLICRSCSPRNWSSSSTCRRPRYLALRCRRSCSPASTRQSSSGACCICPRPLLCRFSDAGTDALTARSVGRRPKSAKARNRVGR